MSRRIGVGELYGVRVRDLHRTYVNRRQAPPVPSYGFVLAEVSSLW